MLLYETMVNTNEKIIKKQNISKEEKNNIVNFFLKNISTEEKVNRFRGKSTKNMYPFYYIPTLNNDEKYRMITGYKPKTNILSANTYELEILMLLHLFDGKNKIVKDIVNNTINRLDKTCFGHYCSKGECLPTSIVVLRFLNTVRIGNEQWFNELFDPMIELFLNQGGMGTKNHFQFYYFCLALCELPIEMVEKYIRKKKDFLIRMLTRGCLIGPAINDTYSTLYTIIMYYKCH
ncbi:hypothetical protein AGMMS4952_26100 [Spirochaetia bacterium]|nr:hypothetical protein AGMMS4952_26100 [Spirochaetia bacterium]